MGVYAPKASESGRSGPCAAQFRDFDPPRIADDHVAHDAEPIDEQTDLTRDFMR